MTTTRRRHRLALTNSTKAADIIEQHARDDFGSIERNVALYPGYGWCIEITVDADEFVDHGSSHGFDVVRESDGSRWCDCCGLRIEAGALEFEETMTDGAVCHPCARIACGLDEPAPIQGAFFGSSWSSAPRHLASSTFNDPDHGPAGAREA